MENNKNLKWYFKFSYLDRYCCDWLGFLPLLSVSSPTLSSGCSGLRIGLVDEPPIGPQPETNIRNKIACLTMTKYFKHTVYFLRSSNSIYKGFLNYQYSLRPSWKSEIGEFQNQEEQTALLKSITFNVKYLYLQAELIQRKYFQTDSGQIKRMF